MAKSDCESLVIKETKLKAKIDSLNEFTNFKNSYSDAECNESFETINYLKIFIMKKNTI